MANILKLQDDLKGLPDNALIQYAQSPNGQVPQYLVLGELQRRKTMREEYQQSQTQAPQSTVAEDLEQGLGSVAPQEAPQEVPQEAPQEQPVVQAAAGGLADLDVPDHMFQEHNMAGGGIVAFDEGGHVPRYAGNTDGSLVRSTMTKERFYSLSPEEQQAYLDEMQLRALQKDELGIETVNPELYALGAGKLGLSGVSGVGKYLAGRYPRFSTIGGKNWAYGPGGAGEITSGIAKDVGKSALYPFKLAAERPFLTTAGGVGAASLFGGSDMPDGTKERKMLFPSEGKQPAMQMSPEQAATVLNKNSEVLNTGILSPRGRAGDGSAPKVPGVSDQQYDPTKFELPIAPTIPRTTIDIPKELGVQDWFEENKESLKAAGIDPEYYSKKETKYKERVGKLGEDKKTAGLMALTEFGFRLAGSKSPYFGQAAGEAGVGALQTYSGEMKDLKKREDALQDAQDRNEDAKYLLARGDAGRAQDAIEKRNERVQLAKTKQAEIDANREQVIATLANQIKITGMNNANSMAIARMQIDGQREVARMQRELGLDNAMATTLVTTATKNFEALLGPELVKAKVNPEYVIDSNVINSAWATAMAQAGQAVRQAKGSASGVQSSAPTGNMPPLSSFQK
jgi:hypothetical protein